MEQLTPCVYRLHIADTHAFHPGGTNIYFVGDPKDEMVLVDSGEQDRKWTRQILKAYRELGRPRITAIVITHGHTDHIGGLDRVHAVIKAPVRCHPKLVEQLAAFLGKKRVVALRPRERITTGAGAVLQAWFTPGHAVDHVCYSLRSDGVVFTGDTILGSSTSTVQDLPRYMRSLATIQRLRPQTICPAHGKVVTAAAPWVKEYISHRNLREQQVLEAVKAGVSGVDEMVKRIYPKNLKKKLRPAAANNVRQHLAKLTKERLVTEVPARYTWPGEKLRRKREVNRRKV